MTIFYFTGTGNSLFVAKKISEHSNGNLISIPQIINTPQTYTDDVIGFVFPQYSVGLPKIVRKFAVENKFKAKYIFAVALYAFIKGGALPELNSIVLLNYGAYLKTPNNFIFLFDAPREQEKALRKCEKPLSMIIEEIRLKNTKKIKIGKRIGNATKYFNDNKFSVSDCCVGCGLCSKVCPVGNIEIKNKPVFSKKCEMCFACANLCPQSALNSNKYMASRRRYRNPIITETEIIKSNNQIN